MMTNYPLIIHALDLCLILVVQTVDRGECNIFTKAPLVQALISVQALVFDLAQLTCQKRFDCRKAILRSSAILLGTSYSQIVVAVLL